jgi:hypothetical protein
MDFCEFDTQPAFVAGNDEIGRLWTSRFSLRHFRECRTQSPKVVVLKSFVGH